MQTPGSQANFGKTSASSCLENDRQYWEVSAARAFLSRHGVTHLTADGDRGRDHRLRRLFDAGAEEAKHATGRVGLQTVEACKRVIEVFRRHATIGCAQKQDGLGRCRRQARDLGENKYDLRARIE